MVGCEAFDGSGRVDLVGFGSEHEIEPSGREVSREGSLVLRVVSVLDVLCGSYQKLSYGVAKRFGSRIEVAANDRRFNVFRKG